VYLQVFIKLRGSRKSHLATSHNLATLPSYTNLSSQPHKH